MLKKENKYLIYDVTRTSRLKEFVKCIIGLIESAYYNALYTVIRPREYDHPQYNVSICAIFKDEGPYLREWIEFHRIVGVEHFYLYNNKSSDNYDEILAPYIEEGLVEVKNWPRPQSQMAAYQDFMENKAYETKWVGFIDIDEYVIPNKVDDIYDFLKGFENRTAVIIYWKYMGSSGLVSRDTQGLITEDFVIGWPKYADIGKVFFNTRFDYVPEYRKNRYMHYMWGGTKGIMFPPVNLFQKICPQAYYNAVHTDDFPIQINHYVIKSYQEYVDKKSKRGGGVHAKEQGFHDLRYFYEHDEKCQAADYHAYKYLIRLKLAMNREEETG